MKSRIVVMCLAVVGFAFDNLHAESVEDDGWLDVLPRARGRVVIIEEEEELILGRPTRTIQPVQLKRKRVRPAPPPWIPAGKFGLELKDGTRIIGIPAKTWAATLKTRFGIVTIPRDEISKVESANGEVRIHLKNGDRVSGKLVAGTMSFETAFGNLAVPANELVRLSTRDAIAAQTATTPPKKQAVHVIRPVSHNHNFTFPTIKR